jgi:hypothetical protein
MIDGIVNGVGFGVEAAALSWRRVQTGNVQNYALAMVVGAVTILSYYWLR